jgi:16S rRNA (cytosine967-C5)-methyltransferase
MNVRTLAAQALEEVRSEKRSLNTVLPKALEQALPADQALLQELLFGSCRWFFFLERVVSGYLQRPLHRKDTLSKTFLIIGAYQLLFTRIPDHAAIHETVEAAKELGLENTKGLINAILRQIARDEKPEIGASAIEQSFPEWFSAKLGNNWPEHYEQILKASNQHPPMTLRVNTSKVSRDAYLAALKEAGTNASPCVFSTKGIQLETPCDIKALPNFDAGFISVQDEAAQLSTQLLELEPGMRVLDACAAPGGKTCAMLESQPDLDVLALDQDARRLKRVDENLQRLGLTARTKAAPAQETSSWFDGDAFDRILIDAPCSATGVIRRHPDIKLLREPSDLKNLAELQLQLLTTLWETLKSGGLMVYATCSIFPQENARVIERFLKAQEQASLTPIEQSWGFDTGFGTQLFPEEGAHDGFFYAVLIKE